MFGLVQGEISVSTSSQGKGFVTRSRICNTSVSLEILFETSLFLLKTSPFRSSCWEILVMLDMVFKGDQSKNM